MLTFATLLLVMYLIETAEHSGYDFVQPAFTRTHDLHHEKSGVHYGMLHIVDWVHGTDCARSDKEKRNKGSNLVNGEKSM